MRHSDLFVYKWQIIKERQKFHFCRVPLLSRKMTWFVSADCIVLTVGLLSPRSLGNLSTSCKYHFKGLSVWPPDEARKPMAISNDERTSQTSDKEERKSTIIWRSTKREMGSCRKTHICYRPSLRSVLGKTGPVPCFFFCKFMGPAAFEV